MKIVSKCFLLASLVLPSSHAFLMPSTPAISVKVQKSSPNRRVSYSSSSSSSAINEKKSRSTIILKDSSDITDIVVEAFGDDDDNNADEIADSYNFFGVASATVWAAVAVIVLSHHPDPKFIGCTMKHNILTMSQALAFPLPILWCTFASLQDGAQRGGWKRLGSATYQRLNLGLVVSSLWLAAAAGLPGIFAFGYDLIPGRLKISAAAIHACSAFLGVQVWKKSDGKIKIVDSIKSMIKKPVNKVSTLYTVACAGLLGLSALPVVASYPLATIPSVLGKRLARPASAFYFLAAVASYCIKDAADRDRLDASTFQTLRKGLAIGSGLHLLLIALKLIGIDDGGLLLTGRGLWEVYPAMMAVPFAAASSFALHAILVFAAMV
mmetsp:Transcript_30414/g.50186  ORF Transcript_30414/g.50186 Transcript_30414/m.50186 type:complete len:381 (+) Transcript_30414:2-1144(+)